MLNFELAEKLREKGYPQESEKYWVRKKNVKKIINKDEVNHYFDEEVFAALSSDEILEQLPSSIKWAGEYTLIDYDLLIEKLITNCYQVCYAESAVLHKEIDDVLSNALAKMWLYLKKENYYEKT